MTSRLSVLLVGLCVGGWAQPAEAGPPAPQLADEWQQAKPIPAGRLEDFAWVRSQAKALAASWNAKAELFRADLWGAYNKSRFQPAGARLLFFVPQEWSKGVPAKMPATRANLVKNLINLLTLRGDDLETLHRNEEARVCYQRILALEPANEEARKGVQRTAR
jgi:hypothetical protein